jgi:hypothetical protein
MRKVLRHEELAAGAGFHIKRKRLAQNVRRMELLT